MPFGYAFNFDNYLFNKIVHINRQGVEDRADYFLVNNVNKRIEGKIHFLLKDGVAYSPYKSLFGSFEFSPRIHPHLLSEFWQFIENDLKNRGCTMARITNFADCYSPEKAAIILSTLSANGFEITLKAVNHHIEVREEPLENRMHKMEVRRLRKCRKEGFEFISEPLENAEKVFDYLQECREERGLGITIPKEKFLLYLELFPQSYPFFTIRKDRRIIAASIGIRVHRQILYNFIPGNKREFHNFSPMAMLNDGLYQYCRDHQIGMLDLGISTEPSGKHQESLINFKEHIGAERSYKYFFAKEL